MADERYFIRRFFQDPDTPAETRERGLTLEEAQAHCKREDTHGEGWFDGYEQEVARPDARQPDGSHRAEVAADPRRFKVEGHTRRLPDGSSIYVEPRIEGPGA